MPTQIPLPGIDAAPKLTDRLFFAVVPESGVAKTITHIAHGLRVEHGLSGTPIDAGHVHISIHGLDRHAQIPRRLVAVVAQAASMTVVPPFMVNFDRALSFTGGRHTSTARPFVLRSSNDLTGLIALHRALAISIEAVGLPRPPVSGFTPHVTLLYDKQSVVERPVEPVSWMVREFVLVYSRPRQPYEFLGRWPLRD